MKIKKVLPLIHVFVAASCLNAQSQKIKGILLYSNGVPAAGHEITADEINKETVTSSNGYWEIEIPDNYLRSGSITIRLSENTPYSFHKERDSSWVIIPPDKSNTLVKMTLHNRPVLYMHSNLPVFYNDTYNPKYTIFLFTLSKRLTDVDLWKIKKKFNTDKPIEVHSHYDINMNHQLRYTIGRFDKIEEAESLINKIKTTKIDEANFTTSPPYIVTLLLTKPAHTFYRVQVRSSNKPVDKYEKVKIENRINRPIIEVKDLSVNRNKYDYFIETKIEKEDDARKICSDIRNKGVKDAYVVRFQVLENKVVKTTAMNKVNKNIKKI